ncbi:MAG TPA: AMP-binding protein [Synergistaceae bacterium]|nr:AMP-binding protein [Synergistaceae bacterium]
MNYLRSSKAPALIFGNREISYDELLGHSRTYARLLDESPCSKVGIFGENCPEWAYALYGAWKKGCMVIPLDAMASPEELAFMLEDSRPEVLFCSRKKLENLQQALETIPYPPRILVFEKLQEPSENSGEASESEGEVFERSDEETALIIYTSGTTGSPKGAMLSFENLRVNAEAVSSQVPIYTEGCRMLALLPLHHVLPLVGTLVIPLYVGGTTVFCPSLTSEDILQTLKKHRITMLLGVPRLYNLFYEGIHKALQKSFAGRMLFSLACRINRPGFSRKIFRKVHQHFGGHIRFMICGGAALENHVARAFKALGFDLLLGYGMTESAPLISFTRPGTMKEGSVGEISPCSEVRILEGEILARGNNIMQGYYHRPEETAEVLKDGWLHTGDLGYLDEEGFLFLTGRKKHTLILSNGKNINPEEMEHDILRRFNTVREIALCLHREELHALIYPDFSKLHEKGIHSVENFFRSDVIEPYNHKVSPYKRIRKFTILREELPKTRLQKIKRFQLEELIRNPGKRKEGKPEPEYEEYRRIRDFLATLTSSPLFPEAHLEIDLHLDSLDKVSLEAFVEGSFGVELGDREMLSHSTLETMARYIREKREFLEKEEPKEMDWGSILRSEMPLDLPESSFLHPLVVWSIRVFLRSCFRISATGREHLARPPFLLVANHQSYLDGLMLASFFDRSSVRKLYFYATERHFRKSWQKLFAAKNNIILVDVNRQLRLSLQKMARALTEGGSLAIFPEGSRTRDGNMGDFKKTFAILSGELNIPIVPAAIQGAYEALPRNKKFPKLRQPIRVDFLPPLFPEGKSYEEITALVREAIATKLEA